ncbi:MAG: HAMP domain-containing protein [Proteobacteria bacterium]|nr:HAMP domain-containing protein [Pseudomonadota bacterium]
MTLRGKLITVQIAVIAILAVAFGVLIAGFFSRTLPMLTQGLATKTHSCLQGVLRDADLGLGAQDQALLARAMDRCNHGQLKDPDLAFVAVLDREGKLVASRGRAPARLGQGLPSAPYLVLRAAHGFRGYAEVALEGMRLGTVVAEYSTARLEQWKHLIVLFSASALVLVLLSTLASVGFAMALVKPLRHMIRFVHQVAQGRLESRLEVQASDELGLLAEDLNTMTTKLRRSRELLAEASRGAGMAEVAISVLHNVGNVLNSVNTSTYVIGDQVRRSKASTVARLAELIDGHAADLPAFLSEDERGKRVPALLSAVAEQLATERTALLDEIRRLRESVTHINTIVATQQQYAGASMIEEGVDLAEVADSALQLSDDAYREGQVAVVRDYVPLPRVATDRHKVVQILVNLLRNAREALGATEPERREVTVRLRPDGERVLISVTDTGVGIREQDLTRIFRHGFTTKEHGHGFGLHYSANSATDLGGSLDASSAGPGTGATFTLVLPLPESAAAPQRVDETPCLSNSRER